MTDTTKLVPLEPTEEMLDAFVTARSDALQHVNEFDSRNQRRALAAGYKAMLAAAPSLAGKTFDQHWFNKGRESVLRKNESGCCCKIDEDGETILSPCDAHKAWKAAALSRDDREHGEDGHSTGTL